MLYRKATSEQFLFGVAIVGTYNDLQNLDHNKSGTKEENKHIKRGPLKEPKQHILEASLRINNNMNALGVIQHVFKLYLEQI